MNYGSTINMSEKKKFIYTPYLTDQKKIYTPYLMDIKCIQLVDTKCIQLGFHCARTLRINT